MIKKLVLLSIIILAGGSPAYAEPFIIKDLTHKPKTIKAYKKDDGKPLWQNVVRSATIEAGNTVLLHVIEDGKGIWGGDKERTWHMDAFYILEGERITPNHSLLTYYDMNGTTVEVLEKKYSEKDRKVICIKNGEKKVFDFEEDLIDKEVLGPCFMNYPFERKGDLEFHMMTNEPAHYKMTMVNKGTETLSFKGKPIDCHKLQMIPDLGMLGIFGAFVPKTYFWYTVMPPHEFIRYEGLESGLNTPYIVMEAQD